jgi:putative Mg2+ transporter-C (MgtC) family protein
MISPGEVILRLVLAAVLGGAVGFEREIHGRPAGIRTYLILSLGSALIMIISEYLLVSFEGVPPGAIVQVDPGRIAAQAVTGIGFLGAGVIIRYKDTIRGLTTAACVWTACAVGLAVGAGFYIFGAFVTFLTVFALVGIKAFERRLPKDWFKEISVVSEDVPGVLKRIQDIIVSHDYEVLNSAVTKNLEKKEMTANFELVVRTVHPSWQVLQEVFEIPGVRKVDLS